MNGCGKGYFHYVWVGKDSVTWMIYDEEYNDIDSAVTAVIDEIDTDAYKDRLRDVYGDAEICGMPFDSADALEKLDPIAFRVGFNDWTDSIIEEVKEQLQGMDFDDYINIYGVEVSTGSENDDDIEEGE